MEELTVCLVLVGGENKQSGRKGVGENVRGKISDLDGVVCCCDRQTNVSMGQMNDKGKG